MYPCDTFEVADGTLMPLKIPNYVKEKLISLTHFLFIIFFISAEMINSTEINKLLNWYSYVLLPLFFLWYAGILLLWKGKKIQLGAWFLFPVLILEIKENAHEQQRKWKKNNKNLVY